MALVPIYFEQYHEMQYTIIYLTSYGEKKKIDTIISYRKNIIEGAQRKMVDFATI